MPKKYQKHVVNSGWFTKGSSPWNKGTVGVMKPNKTSYKKGQHYSPNTEFQRGDNLREANIKWAGDNITEQGGRLRARLWYEAKPCEVCGDSYLIHRHHIDRDTKNNEPDNIQFLCPKHHKEIHLAERFL